MQKQARNWPVSLSITSLAEDCQARFAQSWNGDFTKIIDPFLQSTQIRADLSDEYGSDCCRLALMVASKPDNATDYCESTFKWLARLFQELETHPQKPFSARIWLEMFLHSRDIIARKKNLHTALARIRHAARRSPLNACLSSQDKNLVGLCLYPFAPVFALYLLRGLAQVGNMQNLLAAYSDLQAVRFRLEKGGWHWAVFQLQSFRGDPLKNLLQLKWVRSACSNKKATLQEHAEGLIICLN